MKATSFLLAATLLAACATTGSSPAQKRQAVLSMRDQTLGELYREYPQSRSDVANAPGYAVFSNANVNLILASFGGGYGVVSEKSGRNTFMNMGEVGIGLGAGVKDFRAVFVFRSRATMDKFIASGWEFGGQADAAAKASDKGAALAGEVVIGDIKIYQLTKTGLALQATIKGTKFWRDSDLN
jgi:lipid-binding SYLF domain-containing protein